MEYALNAQTSNTVINLALVKKKEFTVITRGENKGLQQTSYNIVTDFKTVSSDSKTSLFELKNEIVPSEYCIVIYPALCYRQKALSTSIENQYF